jgi:hypothetical protein
MRATLRPAPILLATLAGLAGCGGPVLFAELELPSVQVTLPQQAFTGVTPPATQTTPVSFDLGASVPVVNEPNVELDLQLKRMVLVLDTANPLNPASFDDIDEVTIRALAPAGSGLADVALIHYVKPAGATGITRIEAASESSTDLTRYLSAGQLDFEATYTGSGLPTADWTADVTADFSMKVKLDYGAYL